MTRCWLGFCLLFSTMLWGQADGVLAGLSEYQQFRTYPYVEKAYRLQQQGQYAAAAAELEQALQRAPGHVPLLLQLFDYQLAIPDVQAAANTFSMLPGTERPGLLLRLIQTLLQQADTPDNSLFRQLHAGLTAPEYQQAALLLAHRYIALNQDRLAYQLLLSVVSANDEILLLRAALAEKLSDQAQVVRDLAALSIPLPGEQEQYRYANALLLTGATEQALSIAQQQPDTALAGAIYRQWLQMQLARNDYHGAEQSFRWLSQHQQLSADELAQRYQNALQLSDWPLAFALAERLELSCWQRLELQLVAADDTAAKRQFQHCQPDSAPALWLVYAERWLSAEQLATTTIAGVYWQQQKNKVLISKYIATRQHLLLLDLLLSTDLAQQYQPQLLSTLDQLANGRQKRDYLQRAYRQAPSDALLERLSFQYMLLGQYDDALALLQAALPLSAPAMADGVLPQRLLNLLLQQPQLPDLPLLQALADWGEAYRTERAELWRLAGQCQQSIRLLPAPDSAAAWRVLALCETDSRPEVAIRYWQQVNALQPGAEPLRAQAYLYSKLQQPAQALQYFLQIPEPERLAADHLAIAELALQQQQLSLAQQHWQLAGAADNRWYLVGSELAWRQGDAKAALAYLDHLDVAALQLQQQAAYYAQRAMVYQQLQQPEQALAAWQQALQLAPQQPDYLAGYGYLLARLGDAAAIDYLQQAVASGLFQQDAALAAQLAYLYAGTGQLAETLHWLRQSIDLQAAEQPVAVTPLFTAKRYYQQISSPWQLTASTRFNSNSGAQDVWFAQADNAPRNELALRLEYYLDQLTRDLALYWELGANGSSSSPYQHWGQQLGIGYRPLTDYNLWLMAGLQEYPLAEGHWRPQLRLSADFLNQPPWQAEWRPEAERWQERKLYFDLVWWLQNPQQLFAQARYEQGMVWKLSHASAQTAKLYGYSQFDYRRQHATEAVDTESWRQYSIGLGVQWRLWWAEQQYHAYRHRLEVNLEWQHNISGNLSDKANGLALQLVYAF